MLWLWYLVMKGLNWATPPTVYYKIQKKQRNISTPARNILTMAYISGKKYLLRENKQNINKGLPGERLWLLYMILFLTI